MVYFDATDYRHYSSTRPLATRPPGVVDAAAHDVAGSRALRDWLDDSDDGGPGSLVQSLQHVDDPDGVPSILRGGLQRSEVDRVYQVLVGVCDSTRSVLEWVQASATGTTSRVSGRIVQFCGVAYRAPDGVSHPIYGGEHWGRGRRGRYLDTGDGPIPDQKNRTRNSNILVCFLQRRLATAEAQLEVLGDVLATWDTQCTFTIADTTRLHRVLTETALGMDGLSCSCQRFQIARCIADDEAGTMRDDDADGAVTDLTLVQSPCVGTWCRPVAASCVLVFQCVGGICRLDADSRDTLERDARSLTLSHRSTGGPGARNARGSSGGSSQRTHTDGQGGGGGERTDGLRTTGAHRRGVMTGPTSACTPDSRPVAGRSQRTPPSSGGSQRSRRRLWSGTDGRDAQCTTSAPFRFPVVDDTVQPHERRSPSRMSPLLPCTRTQRPTCETRRQLSPRGGRAPGGLSCARSQSRLHE